MGFNILFKSDRVVRRRIVWKGGGLKNEKHSLTIMNFKKKLIRYNSILILVTRTHFRDGILTLKPPH